MPKISGSTELVGIIGYPVTHSLSPLIHNFAFEVTGLDMCYIPFETKPERLADSIKGLKALGVKGVNVTLPHKENVVPFCDELSDTARILSAVNTISISDNIIYGDNTDSLGFINAWHEDIKVPLKDKNALLIGAGGGARAVYYALATEKVKKIAIFNRTPHKAQKLHDHFIHYFPELERISGSLYDENSLYAYLCECDILINCTSVGMSPKDNETPITLPPRKGKDLILYDLIYNPQESLFLREGKKMGYQIFNGLGMLLHQGALSFEIWTGEKFPLRSVKKYIKEKSKL